MGDEVYEVLGFSEFIEVFSINHVAKLVLDLDNQLDNVEGVETVVLEGCLEGDLGLLCGAEIVLYDAEDILSDLIVVL